MAEEMMSHVDRHKDGVNDGTMSNNRTLKKNMDGHYPKSYFKFDKNT